VTVSDRPEIGYSWDNPNCRSLQAARGEMNAWGCADEREHIFSLPSSHWEEMMSQVQHELKASKMAAIGTLSLACNGTLSSGLAQLLVKAPQAMHEFTHTRATFRVSPDCPFVICCFPGAGSHEDVLSKGGNLLQEGLDLLSMTGRADLATHDALDEYFCWWQAGGRNVVAAVSTVTFPWSVDSPVLGVPDSAGNIIPPKEIIPQHHSAFRFYRLAQVSDDLFDAFRNMYLAFERFLSARYPKKAKEKEIDWLRKSLAAAANDLSLSRLTPVFHAEPVKHVIDVVYNNARLPLFHAKRTYFAPYGNDQKRKAVTDALRLLNVIVVKMAEAWHQTRCISGGVNLEQMEEHHKTLFNNVEFVVLTGQENIRSGARFEAKLRDQFNGQRRAHVGGSMDVPPAMRNSAVGAAYLVKNYDSLIKHTFEAALHLQGIDLLEIYSFLRQSNATEPRTFFSR
jgi:hypothetical protein